MVPGPLAFGDFRLDPAERRLTRDGRPVEVSGRYFDALHLLARESGRLVTKDRFLEEVWRGVPVTDEALTQCIRSLRKALGDEAAAPRFIETVPRHGYRFLVPAAGVDAAPSLAAPHAPASTAVPLVAETVAGAMGGAMAGIIAALLYLSAGLVTPAMGTASTLVVLVSMNLLLGLAAGAAVTAGAMLGQRTGPGAWRTVLSAALGGLVVGAVAHMIGNDLFELLFGRAPGAITGAGEGYLIGAGVGAGLVLARRGRADRLWPRVVPGFACGAVAGGMVALCGGRLMAGSLAELARAFPGSRLGMAVSGPAGDWLLAAATVCEAALFTGGVVTALIVLERLRRPG